MTADMRAIWTAGKRLSALLLFLALTLSANAQLPPILRNQWTTNANPLALKVISTNGVHAATNVWELDFTNTATVTVSAVSNANKVMVSFTGSGGGGDTIWTNYGANAYTLMAMPGTIQVFTNGVISAFPTGTNRQSHLTNGGFMGLYSIDSPGTFGQIIDSGVAIGKFYSDDGLGNADSDVKADSGALAIANVQGSSNVTVLAQDGGLAAGFAYWSTNIDIFGDSGGFAGGYTESSVGVLIRAVDGSIAGGQVGVSHGGLAASKFIVVQASDGGLAFGNIMTSSNVSVLADEGGISAVNAEGSTNSFAMSQDGSIVAAFIQGANTTNHAFIGSIAVGISRTGERLFASGALDGVGALSVGRDIASTNNWTFGIHGTNSTPLSLALANNGIQFQVESNGNIGTIRGVSGYSWPTAHAAGVWTNDGTGVTGWKPLSDFVSGGGGIASVFTNNVLAGGPGLTELEFTNTSSVTWVATTNAGRVTMSATSVGGGSGIATNEGTGFKTTFYGQTNFGNITFTNGARIEQPTATITRFTNSTFDFGGDMTFTPDSTWSIGSGTKRPNHFNMAGVLTAGSHVTTFGSFLLGNNGGLTTIADGSAYLRNNAATDWGRLAFGGSTAAFPALKRNAGHLAVIDAAGSNSTNSLFFGNTVDTTASTGMTMNRQTGRVRLSAGNQTYLVTNNLATASSIVTATVNSDDSTALSVKAIPSAGVITLKVNAAATANTDISFFISAP